MLTVLSVCLEEEQFDCDSYISDDGKSDSDDLLENALLVDPWNADAKLKGTGHYVEMDVDDEDWQPEGQNHSVINLEPT